MGKLDLGDISAIGAMMWTLGTVLATNTADVIFCTVSAVFWLVIYIVSDVLR